jgi:ribosome-associated protein
MDLQKLQRIVVDALEDIKGQDIRVYNTIGLSDMFDRVVLASGTSNRQTRALASSVAERVKAAGGKVVSVEGTDSGEWVLVDLGDIVVHIMQPSIRAYYELEEIWGSKPVRIKSAGERTTERRARAGGATQARKPAAKRPAAKRPAARSAKTTATAAKKSVARATSAEKSAAAGKRAAKSATRAASQRRTAPAKKARKAATGPSARRKAAKKPAR